MAGWASCHGVMCAQCREAGVLREGVYKRGLPHLRAVCSELVFNGEQEAVRQRHGRWSDESIAFIRTEG